MKRDKFLPCAFAVLAASVSVAAPTVNVVSLTQDATTRALTVSYTLAGGPAIVTVDFRTNGVNGAAASVGGGRLAHVTGDAFKLVSDTSGKIVWDIDRDFPDLDPQDVQVEVSAYAPDDAPDYLVVDLLDGEARYYPSADFVPGGVLGNADYRVSKLLLRRIHASNVTWPMGSADSEVGRQADETQHEVTLTNDYYMGVFEITQAQWELVQSGRSKPAHFTAEAAKTMRPVEKVCYNELRCAALGTTAADTSCYYPNAPKDSSFLGLLRAKTEKTELAFDLPSEAQWEFACRAGNGDGKWGDGSKILGNVTDANLPGRYLKNGGTADGNTTSTSVPATTTVTNGTAVCGSYAPNAWGLYDMHGNVLEWCLDWYADDITGQNGAVNETAGTARVRRGGCWWNQASAQRSARRHSQDPAKQDQYGGFRVACPVKK